MRLVYDVCVKLKNQTTSPLNSSTRTELHNLARAVFMESNMTTAIKERPILFSGPMVRAILDGSKTQTRRVLDLPELKRSDTPGYDWTWRGQAPIKTIKQQQRHPGGCWQDVRHDKLLSLCPFGDPGDGPLRVMRESMPGGSGYYMVRWEAGDSEELVYLTDLRQYDWCDFDESKPKDADNTPPFTWGRSESDDPESVSLDIADPWEIQWRKPGDKLWVREAFSLDHKHYYPHYPIVYRAEGYPDDHDIVGGHIESPEAGGKNYPFKWRPSIHMPRWASRITLEITGVRVERLQEISRGDAMAEGCPFPNMANGEDPRDWFCDLWDSINAKTYPWDINPWVWVVEFEKLKQPY